jgi:hypothetical protein
MKLEVWEALQPFVEKHGAPVITDGYFFFANGHSEVILSFYPNGQMQNCRYLSGERNHRNVDDGPALHSFYQNGNPRIIQYLVNGVLHRAGNLPAYQSFNQHGKCLRSECWIDGERVRSLV